MRGAEFGWKPSPVVQSRERGMGRASDGKSCPRLYPIFIDKRRGRSIISIPLREGVPLTLPGRDYGRIFFRSRAIASGSAMQAGERPATIRPRRMAPGSLVYFLTRHNSPFISAVWTASQDVNPRARSQRRSLARLRLCRSVRVLSVFVFFMTGSIALL